jgi:hypothetical protein
VAKGKTAFAIGAGGILVLAVALADTSFSAFFWTLLILAGSVLVIYIYKRISGTPTQQRLSDTTQQRLNETTDQRPNETDTETDWIDSWLSGFEDDDPVRVVYRRMWLQYELTRVKLELQSAAAAAKKYGHDYWRWREAQLAKQERHLTALSVLWGTGDQERRLIDGLSAALGIDLMSGVEFENHIAAGDTGISDWLDLWLAYLDGVEDAELRKTFLEYESTRIKVELQSAQAANHEHYHEYWTTREKQLESEERRAGDAFLVADFMVDPMSRVDAMSGLEFETYVAGLLRARGWQVETTAVIGDYGVDLIATSGSERMAVQCKCHRKSVGVSAVQQVVAGAKHYRCTTSMVVSNQEFTRAAVQLASSHSCRLIGRDLLLGVWGKPGI